MTHISTAKSCSSELKDHRSIYRQLEMRKETKMDLNIEEPSGDASFHYLFSIALFLDGNSE